MAKVYLAGSYARRNELFDRAKELVQAGHTVTSRWLKGNDLLPVKEQVAMDLVDLGAADTVLSFTGPEGQYHSGGRHVELGYAMAMNAYGGKRRLMLVGWPENIFHYANSIENFPTFEQALVALGPVTAGSVMADAREKAATL